MIREALSFAITILMVITVGRVAMIFNLMTWKTRYTAILMFFLIGMGAIYWVFQLLTTDNSPDIGTMLVLSGLGLWSLFDRGHIPHILRCSRYKSQS